MKNLILLLSVFLSFSTLQASDVSDWFERESNQFLEIMNNNEGTDSENYERYKYFVSKNFAVKSIAYGLIGDNIIEKSSNNELSLYLEVFTDYLIKTIYKLANSNLSSCSSISTLSFKPLPIAIYSRLGTLFDIGSTKYSTTSPLKSLKLLGPIIGNTI